MKDRLLTVLKIVISLGLVVYLFSKVDLGEVSSALASADYLYLILALILYLGAITSGCLKWYILLRAQGIQVPFPSLLSYTFVGVFFNNFLPANVGGDVMRGYGLARYTERTAEAAISVVVDRVVGLIAFMSAAVVTAIVAVYATGRADLRGIFVAALVALGAIIGGFALVLSRRLRARVGRLLRLSFLAPLTPVYERLSGALTAYRHSYGALAVAFSTSILTLILSNFVNYLIAEALGGGMPLLYIFLFNPLIAFVLLIPISVGGLGVGQGAYVFFFGLAGVSEHLSLSVSLVLQLIIYISSLPGGLLWWWGRETAGLQKSGERKVAKTAAIARSVDAKSEESAS
ncbi:MAG: lysylphosphatidylglycerol synthase transmembrane domain-containing protein [Anaerolineae bacterium]